MRVPALLEQWALGLVGGVMAVDLAFDLPVVLDAASPAAVARAVAYYKVMHGLAGGWGWGGGARGDAVYVPPNAGCERAWTRTRLEGKRGREREKEREKERENARGA